MSIRATLIVIALAVAFIPVASQAGEEGKALLVMKSVEDKGEYLGKKLDRDRCERLRKTYSLGSMIDAKD